jgi:hypothetical protein
VKKKDNMPQKNVQTREKCTIERNIISDKKAGSLSGFRLDLGYCRSVSDFDRHLVMDLIELQVYRTKTLLSISQFPFLQMKHAVFWHTFSRWANSRSSQVQELIPGIPDIFSI